MKRFIQIILCVIAAMAVTSCLSDNNTGGAYNYTLTAFGTPGTGVNQFVTDEGIALTITQDRTDGGWKSLDRLYIIYQLRKEKSQTDPDVNLTYYEEITALNPIVKSTAGEIKDDAMQCIEGTLSGNGETRFLNLLVCYPYVEGSGKIHTIYVVYDDENSTDSTVHLLLRHDADGETIAGGLDGSKLKLHSQYISVPFQSILPENPKSSIDLIVHYDWYVYDSEMGAYTEATEEKLIYGNGIATDK